MGRPRLYGSDDDRLLASVICHLGQPVKIATPDGGTTGALRVCASGRTIVAMSKTGGIEAVATDVASALAKTVLLVRHIDALKTAP